jgi:hypothetical protein
MQGPFRFGKNDDPVPRSAGPIQANRWNTPSENRELSLNFRDGQAVGCDLFFVFCGPAVRALDLSHFFPSLCLFLSGRSVARFRQLF